MANSRRGAPSKRPRRDLQAPPEPLAPGLAVRLAAAAAFANVLTGRTSLEDRVAADVDMGRSQDFDARDMALWRSIVVVSLRRRGTIKRALDRFLEKGLPNKAHKLESILITAAAQILFLEVPDHSAVDLAVRATKLDTATAPFAALVNAILRNIARNREELLVVDDPFLDMPQWLAARWIKHWGPDSAARLAIAHRREPNLDLTVRSDPSGWAERLGGIVLPNGSVRLKTKMPIEQLDGYDDGAWWVQDCAASLPVQVLDPQPGERIVDLCAAPGGKTAQLAAAEAQVTAVDRSAQRLKRLNQNLQRLRLDADIRASDALSFSGGPYDGIVLDAPCTSTGTIRRHPEIAWIKRQDDLSTLSTLQSKLLDHAFTLLRPGGRLIYCTCSLEPEEGEMQIAALLRRNPDIARMPISAAEIGGMNDCITEIGDIRTLPYFLRDDDPRLSGMDGFFIARLLRKQ